MTDTLAVGIAGHRFLVDLPRLEAGIEEALRRLEAAFPGRSLIAVSSLAEGADRLVARAILRREGARLVVPLPLPEDEYVQDFATDESRREFGALLSRATQVIQLPPAPTREAAYEQGGVYVVEHADALIALWDGQAAQGQGGTGAIVRRALERGIPVCHIKTGNRKPGTNEATTLGEEQGKLVVHNL